MIGLQMAKEKDDKPDDSILPKLTAGAEGLRRNFFSDALRGVIGPVSDIFEARVNPFLRALSDIPAEIDKLVDLPPMDQPQDQTVFEPDDADYARRFGLQVLPNFLLRPPGAQPPGKFEDACSRCGKCVEVCPANAIKIDPNQRIGGGYPFIVAADRPCVVCVELACMNQCPTGALKLVDKFQIRMGTAHVNHKHCLRSKGEECTLCVNACPVAAEAISISSATGKVRVKKSGCIGCGMCENVCPTEPRAIEVRPYKTGEEVIVA
jgi:MauM/NapG family ferredoxin protein